jgi:hypothetical protein
MIEKKQAKDKVTYKIGQIYSELWEMAESEDLLKISPEHREMIHRSLESLQEVLQDRVRNELRGLPLDIC